MQRYEQDPRIVMTLDAGGTNFVFSAVQSNRLLVGPFSLPACGDDLERSLDNLIEGFRRVRAELPSPPVAISFAFPAPADYARGIVVSPGNLPAYRNVPLAAFLEDTFGLPTFINNDGDLFTLGEAIAGFLPYVNSLLERAGSPKRYRNLLGVTLGTGFGAGIVHEGRLFRGDNSAAGEIWLMRHKLQPQWNVEEGVSIRGVQRAYAQYTGIRPEEAPDPKVIFEIAEGRQPGDQWAAREAFRLMGELAGDAIAHAVTLIDGLVVIGGGLAGAYRYFLPALVEEMNRSYVVPGRGTFRRLIPQVFNLEEPAELEAFLQGQVGELVVPRTGRRVHYDALQRIGVGLSRLGTSEATSIGAYAYALDQLDCRS